MSLTRRSRIPYMLLSYHVMAWVIQPLLIYVNNIVVISTLSQEYEAQVKALKEKQKKAAEAETGIGRFKIQMGFQFKGLGFYQFCRKRPNLHLSCIKVWCGEQHVFMQSVHIYFIYWLWNFVFFALIEFYMYVFYIDTMNHRLIWLSIPWFCNWGNGRRAARKVSVQGSCL